MQKILLILLVSAIGQSAFSQKIDSIYFHLYTDSLKKGTHNYINVDAKLSNGRWQPLTDKDLTFTTDYGHFSGNDLVLPENPTVKKVTVKGELMGSAIDVTTSFSDYKKTDFGMVLPYSQVLDIGSYTLPSTITKVEANKAIDPAIFEIPK